MGNKIRTWLVPAGMALLFVAQSSTCHRRAGGDTLQAATAPRPTAFLLSKLRKPIHEQPNTLVAKARIFAEGEGSAVEANANIIWIRDSLLWINIKKLGVEAARALVTRDSVFLINRLDNTYSIRSMEALQHEYNMPAGFPMLQALVLASAWMDSTLDYQSDIKDELHRLSGANNQIAADYRLEEGKFLLRSETFLQRRDARMLSLRFDRFKKLAGAGMFPYLRHIELYSPETGNVHIELEISEVEINVSKNIRFEIPAHYQRVEN